MMNVAETDPWTGPYQPIHDPRRLTFTCRVMVTVGYTPQAVIRGKTLASAQSLRPQPMVIRTCLQFSDLDQNIIVSHQTTNVFPCLPLVLSLSPSSPLLDSRLTARVVTPSHSIWLSVLLMNLLHTSYSNPHTDMLTRYQSVA